jgi:fructosamine-3-kinase
MMVDWKNITRRISDALKKEFVAVQIESISGGDSNQAWLLSGSIHTDGTSVAVIYFVKVNDANKSAMFAAEKAGLEAIAESFTVQVPRCITHGMVGQHSFLVLEYLDLVSQGKSKLLGSQLAAMHYVHANQFGWHLNNTIGITPQHNNWTTDWISFWGEQRLGVQLDLAARNGYRGKLQELGYKVIAALPELLAGHNPAPSLLHGDLWGGNHGYLANGTPVIFDPAPYFGDREADIAMTELFGGFDADFYAGYQEVHPLDAGYAKRKDLYNLYHILNHCNMVYGSYVQQAERMMKGLLEQVR